MQWHDQGYLAAILVSPKFVGAWLQASLSGTYHALDTEQPSINDLSYDWLTHPLTKPPPAFKEMVSKNSNHGPRGWIKHTDLQATFAQTLITVMLVSKSGGWSRILAFRGGLQGLMTTPFGKCFGFLGPFREPTSLFLPGTFLGLGYDSHCSQSYHHPTWPSILHKILIARERKGRWDFKM